MKELHFQQFATLSLSVDVFEVMRPEGFRLDELIERLEKELLLEHYQVSGGSRI